MPPPTVATSNAVLDVLLMCGRPARWARPSASWKRGYGVRLAQNEGAQLPSQRWGCSRPALPLDKDRSARVEANPTTGPACASQPPFKGRLNLTRGNL